MYAPPLLLLGRVRLVQGVYLQYQLRVCMPRPSTSWASRQGRVRLLPASRVYDSSRTRLGSETKIIFV